VFGGKLIGRRLIWPASPPEPALLGEALKEGHFRTVLGTGTFVGGKSGTLN
jgi:hypothetical protein